MVIFHSYVSLPEGRIIDHWIIGLQTCNNYPKKISLINGSTAHWVLTWCRLFFFVVFQVFGPWWASCASLRGIRWSRRVPWRGSPVGIFLEIKVAIRWAVCASNGEMTFTTMSIYHQDIMVNWFLNVPAFVGFDKCSQSRETASKPTTLWSMKGYTVSMIGSWSIVPEKIDQ